MIRNRKIVACIILLSSCCLGMSLQALDNEQVWHMLKEYGFFDSQKKDLDIRYLPRERGSMLILKNNDQKQELDLKLFRLSARGIRALRMARDQKSTNPLIAKKIEEVAKSLTASLPDLLQKYIGPASKEQAANYWQRNKKKLQELVSADIYEWDLNGIELQPNALTIFEQLLTYAYHYAQAVADNNLQKSKSIQQEAVAWSKQQKLDTTLLVQVFDVMFNYLDVNKMLFYDLFS